MAACQTLCTIILVVVNVIVALLSLFFLVLGIMLTMAANLMQDLIWPQLQQLLTGPDMQGSIDFSVLFDPELDIFGKLKILSIPMLVVSLIILVITFFGCYGACCKNKFMLGVYSAVMTIIVIGVLVGCLVLYLQFDNAMPAIKSRLGTLVKENYVSERNQDLVSLIFTMLQDGQGCCGSRSGVDYESSLVLERMFGPNQAIPISCCNAYKTADNATLERCTVTDKNNEQISNYNFGCFEAIQRDIKTNFNYFIAGVAGTMVFIAILAIAGWCSFAYVVRQGKNPKGAHGYD